jgi:hypothetical protein
MLPWPGEMQRTERKLIVRLALGLLLLFAAALLVAPRPWPEAVQAVGEGVLFVLWLGWLAVLPAGRAFLGGLPRAHRGLLLGAPLAALLFGQLLDRPEAAFPLGSWRMFAVVQRLEPFPYYEYEGRDAAGRAVEVSPVALFPSLGSYRVRVGLERWLGRAFDAANPSRGEDLRILTETLVAIGQAHARAHPEGPPLRALRVYRCRVDPRRGRVAGPALRALLVEVPLP